ncbi:MAG: hypothetical protein J5826_01660 [Bacteroidales bacterium]|nr:hypothetical protein [Bacteroidales bacterium]
MATNKYKFVKDSNGDLIDIDNITQDNKKNDYYCIECGDTMIAAFGQKRKYFRHKGEVTCNKERYLHKLGKLFFKKMFETNKEFLIHFIAERKCIKSDCFYNNSQRNKNCKTQTVINTINLKEKYDVCEEESGYKGYIADLKLSNSQQPDIEPIFIEIFVTHSCEPEKINSGIKIIEIKIEKEDDVLQPLNEFYNQNVKFYNFNRIIPIEQKFSYYEVTNNLQYRTGEQTCLQNDTNDDYLIKFILNHTRYIDNKAQLSHYALSILAETKNLKYCPFCCRYRRNICRIDIEKRIPIPNTDLIKIIKHRNIHIKDIKGNYLQIAAQCKTYIYDNQVKVYPPLNILKTIYK